MNKELDYSDDSVFTYIDDLVQSARNDDCFLNKTTYTNSWIHDYSDWLSTNYSGVGVNQSEFYRILYDEYLQTNEGQQYSQDLWSTVTLNDGESADVNSYSIRRSRISLNLIPTGTSVDPIADCLDTFKDLQEGYEDDLGTYYYLNSALFAAANLVTIQQTTLSLIYAMSAATVISLILIPYPLMAF